MDFAELRQRAADFGDHLETVKASVTRPAVGWYPRMLPARIELLDQLLSGGHRALLEAPAGPVADIGAADGDLGFFLETVGFDVDLYDGADRPKLLAKALESTAGIHFVHLDHDYVLPRKYHLTFLLHVVYHLRNPFLTLETLAGFTEYCIVSTRIANRMPKTRPWPRRADLGDVPIAYLLDAGELNPNDTASYWIFSEAGFERLLRRTGWDVLESMVVGDPRVGPADPAQAVMWCLAQSRTGAKA
jgi:tRNA (mo5U34)-methyltransferase